MRFNSKSLSVFPVAEQATLLRELTIQGFEAVEISTREPCRFSETFVELQLQMAVVLVLVWVQGFGGH